MTLMHIELHVIFIRHDQLTPFKIVVHNTLGDGHLVCVQIQIFV